MVSTEVIIIALIVLVVIIGVAIFFVIRGTTSSGVTGTTGSTGSICSTCSVVPNGCSASGILQIGFTGSTGITCSTQCMATTSTVATSGCVPPSCGSIYCTPQAALYTNLNGTGNLYNFCSSGFGTSLTSNSCNVPLTAQQLGSLVIQSSSVNNSNLNPIFITTTFLSIYQTTQPTAVGGIPQESIQINMTDPTVVSDPYILYDGNGILSFQRVSDILSMGDINNAIWIYNTDNNLLTLFANIEQNYSLNSTNLQFGGSIILPPINYPCGLIEYVSPSVAIGNTYDPNAGLFTLIQFNNQNEVYPAFGSMFVSTYSNGDYIASGDIFGYQFELCSTANMARWYSISAVNTFLI